MSKATVVQKPDVEKVPAEILAQSIELLANGMKKLNASRLKSDAIVILLQAQTGISRGEIRRILQALDGLDRYWLKPKTK